MPYETTDQLPVNIKKKYSDAAQKAYMETFNSVFAKTKDEARSFAAAASAANKVDGIANVTEGVAVSEDHNFMEASFYFDGEFTEAPVFDEGKGVYKIPATLIKPGLSKNKVYYSEAWLASFAEKMEGGKAYLDHEKKSEIKDRSSRSVRDMAGWYEGVHQDTDMAVKGILNLVETPQTEHIIKLAKANPALVGLSINAKGKASRGKVDGQSAMIAETVERVYSTDIVTEAAAGGEMDDVMGRLVASVPMDIEQIPELDTPDNEATEEIEMEETYKDTAAWLVAESAYKADVSAWLTVENHVKSVEAEKAASIIEAAKMELPEQWRESVKDDLDTIKKLAESLKDEKPDAPVAPAVETEKPEPEPGSEGFKRNFL